MANEHPFYLAGQWHRSGEALPVTMIRDGMLFSNQMNGRSVTWQNATGVDYSIRDQTVE